MLSRAAISEVSLGPFKISDFSMIFKFLPAVIAYSYYEMASILMMRKLLSETFHMVMRNIHKPVYDNDLDYYLLPPSVFGMEEVLTRGFSGRVARVIDNLSVPLMIAVLIAPPIFVGYAFSDVLLCMASKISWSGFLL
jgi:hypothetical protein